MFTDNTALRHRPSQHEHIVLGLRQNLAQFMLLVAVNALVGGALGQERTVLPLLAGQVFHLDLYTSALTYILAFGVAKAITNYFAGTLSDRFGRKPVLVAGWLMALPVPLLLIFGPSWGWIVAANVVLVGDKSAQWLGHHSENAIQDNERNCDEHSDPRFAVLFAIQIKQLNVVLHEHTVFRRLREAVNGVLQHRLVAAGRILDFASKLGIGSGGA